MRAQSPSGPGDALKHADPPAIQGAKDELIPRNENVVTLIIPIQFLEAAKLVEDLRPLRLGLITSDERTNAILVTDTQANVRRVVQMVKELDTSGANISTITQPSAPDAGRPPVSAGASVDARTGSPGAEAQANQGAKAELIPRKQNVLTQMIPLRFSEAAKLANDLRPLLLDSTTITTDERTNVIILTGTQANIRQVVQTVKSLDTSPADQRPQKENSK